MEPSGRWQRIAELLRAAAEGSEVGPALADAAAEALEVDGVGLTMVSAGTHVATFGGGPMVVGLSERQFMLGEGPAVLACRSGAPVLADDLSAADVADRSPVFARWIARRGTRAGSGRPVVQQVRKFMRVKAVPGSGLVMNDARLLIVGSEGGIARGWVDPLRAAGANISLVGDGASALRHLDLLEPELILIDLRLPGRLDGFDTCRAIRRRSATILAVASSTEGPYDEVVALAVGADHFIPSGTPEEVVVARLRSLVRRARGVVCVDASGEVPMAPSSTDNARNGQLRRTQAQQGTHGTGHGRTGRVSTASPAASSAASQGRLALMGGAGPDDPTERILDGDLEIDLAAREVRVGGVEVALARIEFDLLATLARSPRRVFTRDQLMESVWEETFDGSHVLDAHLSRMRGKITAAGGERVGHAVRGVGFRLRA